MVGAEDGGDTMLARVSVGSGSSSGEGGDGGAVEVTMAVEAMEAGAEAVRGRRR